ncbi:MAG: metal-dependent transcriptional regulator [Pirellulaceae bacterium]
MPSLTIENYVKTIYQTCAAQGERAAATGQIATALGVSPGTVTSMLKTLSDGGLAAYTPYEGVQLTDSGLHLALRIVRRHRLIELFLVRTLGFTWDEVHAEAEDMEHAVSDLLVDRIDQFLGFPTADPHGDPIPTADGRVADPEATALAHWEVGHPFRLVRVLDQSPEFLRYLSERQLALGAIGTLVGCEPAADVLTVQINHHESTLSATAAGKLLVSAPPTAG